MENWCIVFRCFCEYKFQRGYSLSPLFFISLLQLMYLLSLLSCLLLCQNIHFCLFLCSETQHKNIEKHTVTHNNKNDFKRIQDKQKYHQRLFSANDSGDAVRTLSPEKKRKKQKRKHREKTKIEKKMFNYKVL